MQQAAAPNRVVAACLVPIHHADYPVGGCLQALTCTLPAVMGGPRLGCFRICTPVLQAAMSYTADINLTGPA